MFVCPYIALVDIMTHCSLCLVGEATSFVYSTTGTGAVLYLFPQKPGSVILLHFDGWGNNVQPELFMPELFNFYHPLG